MWSTQGTTHFCPPYRISREVHGYSVYVFSERRSSKLADRVATLSAAKDVAQLHKAGEGK